jgi:hypothetical protein
MDEARLRELGAVMVRGSTGAPRVPDENIPNIYTNSTQLRISLHDLILTLGVAEPFGEETKPRAVARVIMSPQHAKVLVDILQRHIQLYEATFGPIPKAPEIIPASDEEAEDAPAAEADR